MFIIWLGALLVVCGLLYMVYEALRRGRLSGTRRPPPAVPDAEVVGGASYADGDAMLSAPLAGLQRHGLLAEVDQQQDDDQGRQARRGVEEEEGKDGHRRHLEHESIARQGGRYIHDVDDLVSGR